MRVLKQFQTLGITHIHHEEEFWAPEKMFCFSERKEKLANAIIFSNIPISCAHLNGSGSVVSTILTFYFARLECWISHETVKLAVK